MGETPWIYYAIDFELTFGLHIQKLSDVAKYLRNPIFNHVTLIWGCGLELKKLVSKAILGNITPDNL